MRLPGGHRRYRYVRLVSIAGLIVMGAAASGAHASELRHEPATGVLASVAVPASWQAQYDPFADSVVMLEPERNQVILFSWFAMDPSVAIRNLLAELGAANYAGSIRAVQFAGLTGAEIRIETGTGTNDWFLALERDGILFGVWAKTVGSFDSLSPVLARIVTETKIAPAVWPPLVSGTYQTSSTYSGGTSGSLLGEQFITLLADGTVRSRSAIMGGNAGVSVLGQGSTEGSRWEVRGDRLLIVTAGGEGTSRRLAGVYSNGLSFHGSTQNDRLEHWVRQ